MVTQLRQQLLHHRQVAGADFFHVAGMLVLLDGKIAADFASGFRDNSVLRHAAFLWSDDRAITNEISFAKSEADLREFGCFSSLTSRLVK
jgi:hypothetical protein